METLSLKQREFISKNDITTERDSAGGDFIYLIAGVYYQQKGFKSESEALKAGILKVSEILKKNK